MISDNVLDEFFSQYLRLGKDSYTLLRGDINRIVYPHVVRRAVALVRWNVESALDGELEERAQRASERG